MMEGLESLPSITRLSKTVTRILGQNPGKFTLQGTNTYLVGHHNPYILIDTGEGRDEYVPLLEEALQDITKPAETDQPDISDIIVTHRHQTMPAASPPCSPSSATLGYTAQRHTAPFPPPRIHMIPLVARDTKLQPCSTRSPQTSTPRAFRRAHPRAARRAGPAVTGPSADPSELRDRALFTADTVLGHGSAVFEDLGTYMASLRKMIDFGRGGAGPSRSMARTYLQHRLDREEQIVKVLKWSPPSDDMWTTWSIVSTIYADYPHSLWEPAAESVELHLRKLEAEGRVECVGGRGKRLEWEFIS
ncbi:hypothetical protein B0H21DRAFT_893885 [Amylocystis lapponica]|nr:hypothetical protein B0H21DRAFT_893885 [Amylocystis lapponica]